MERTTLSNLQIELLQMFRYNLTDSQLEEVKKILVEYFAKMASDEMDKLWKKNQWTNATMDNWLTERMRAKL